MAQSFGKYTLLEQIGGGRYSQVFRVGREGFVGDTGTALKRVHPSLIDDEAMVQLVVREAGILARLDHPNLCACLELGVIDGCPTLAMDLVDGCTLRAMMRRISQIGVSLPSSAVIALAYQLCEVLHYLHWRCPTPLVHLDLSPQNVMISRAGEVKLLDLGIARLLDGDKRPPANGTVAGTIGYMSPEQARGADGLEGRADQFGLGVLLWELLAGQRLFAGNTEQTWARMREGDIPASDGALADRPRELVAVVARLLAARPEDRFEDLRATQDALREFSSAPESGRRPLAALVTRLMEDPAFDPFDAVNLARPTTPDEAEGLSASGSFPGIDSTSGPYADFEIAVDQSQGSPAAQMRAAVPTAADDQSRDPSARGET